MRRFSWLSILVLLSLVLATLPVPSAAQAPAPDRIPVPETPLAAETGAPAPAPALAPQPEAMAGEWAYGPSFTFWSGNGIARLSGFYWPETEKVYFLGGRLEDNSTSGMVISFDPISGAYADTGADLLAPVSNYALSRLNIDGADRICAAFGRTGSGGYSTTVQCYNPADNTATQYADASFTGTARLTGAQAVVGNKLYVFGGFTTNSVEAETWVFDPSLPSGSRWSNLNLPLSIARTYIASAVIGTKIYAMGGDTYPSSTLTPSAKTEVLDTADLAAGWQDGAMADLPAGYESGDWPGTYVDGAYSMSGYIYTTGGVWSDCKSWLFQYDPAADTWDVALPAFGTARRNHAMVFVPPLDGLDARLWIFGGYDDTGTNTMTETSEYFVATPVSLSPAEQTSVGQPCAWIDSTVSLANNSGGAHTFDVAYAENTWEVDGPATVGPVADGESVDVTVGVYVPCDASCFEEDSVVVTATAQDNPGLADFATITTQSGGAWVEENKAGSQGGYYIMGTCTDEYGTSGTCFYFGGRDYSPPSGTQTAYSQKYDIAAATWTQVADMPTARFAGLAGWIDGKVYIVGGFTDVDADDYGPTGVLEVYDPATDTWDTTKAPLPEVRGAIQGAVIDGKLYVVGGADGEYIYSTTYEYDPADDAWTEKTFPSGFYPNYGAGAALNGRLYVGGSIGGETAFWSYDPAADQWLQRADIPAAAGQFIPKAEGANNHIFWWGGTVSSFSDDLLDTTWVYDPVGNLWTQSVAVLNSATAGHAGGFADGKLWSFGRPFQNPHESTLPCVPPLPPQGALVGVVLDANTDQPIENARVWVEGVTDNKFYAEKLTDAAGQYSFTLVPGDYLVTVAAYGYYTELQVPVTIVADTILTQNYDLLASGPHLEPKSVSLDVPRDDSAVFNMTLANQGTGDLHFHITELEGAGLLSPNKSDLPMPSGVDPQVYADMKASTDGVAKFVVYLRDQADLTAAFGMKDWSARGKYVLDTLRATARNSQAGLLATLASAGAAYEPRYIVNAVVVTGNAALAEAIAARPEVGFIGPDTAVPSIEPIEESAAPDGSDAIEWNIQMIKADTVWTDLGVTGEGMVLANIDTGVQYDHPALVQQYRGNLGGGSFDHNYNWLDPYEQCPSSGTEPCDPGGHGSHTMGTMVGSDDPSNPTKATNAIGVAPGAKWIACKGGDAVSGYLLNAELIECAEWILAPWDLTGAHADPEMRPDVVNNSWGGGQSQWWYNQAIYAWRAAGIWPSFSNGNEGPNCGTAGDPGEMDNTIAAGATNSEDTIAGFSSRGPASVTGLVKPDVSAPGANVRSSVPTDGYSVYSGTSMASPHVAALAGLIWSAVPELRGNVQVTEWIMKQTADVKLDTQCGEAGPPNNVYGWGRINALSAVQYAEAHSWDVPWLAVDPAGGVVEPGKSQSIALAFDTTGLVADVCYDAELKVEYNDPYVVEEYIPLEMCVQEKFELYLPLVLYKAP